MPTAGVGGGGAPKSPSIEAPPPVFASSRPAAAAAEWGGAGGRPMAFSTMPGSKPSVAVSAAAAFPADDPLCRLWMGHIPRSFDESKLKDSINKLEAT